MPSVWWSSTPHPSPGRCRVAAPRSLIRAVPPFVSSVAVVGGDADTILRLAEATAPDALQLHGDEPEVVVAAVRDGLTGTGIQLVKALRVRRSATVDDTAGWVRTAQSFVEAGADATCSTPTRRIARAAPVGPSTGRSLEPSAERAPGR